MDKIIQALLTSYGLTPPKVMSLIDEFRKFVNKYGAEFSDMKKELSEIKAMLAVKEENENG